jgi:hypothetical protein
MHSIAIDFGAIFPVSTSWGQARCRFSHSVWGALQMGAKATFE